jgi:hypothetical protein
MDEVAFSNLPAHIPRRHWFIALPLQPTLTKGGSMIRLAQKVMMHQAKAHPREHFTFVIPGMSFRPASPLFFRLPVRSFTFNPIAELVLKLIVPRPVNTQIALFSR